MRFLMPFILLAFSQTAFSKSLSYSDYIKLVKENDILLQKIVHQNMQTKFKADLSLPDQSWTLALTKEYGLSVSDDEDTETFSASLEKDVLHTGTEIEINYDQNELTDRNEKSQGIELRQNLFKNAFGTQNRKLKEMLGEDNKLLELQVVDSYESYLAQKTGEYLDYLTAYENHQTLTGIMNEMKSLSKEVSQRLKSGVAYQVDVDRIQAEVLDYQKNVFDAKIEMQNAKRKLYSAIVDPQFNIEESLEPQAEVPYLSQYPDFESDRKNFLSASRTLQILKSSKRSADLNVGVKKHENYPELQLILGYNQEDSRRFSTVVDRDENRVGLSLTYAFDNSIGRAELKQAKYEQQQVDFDNKAKLNDLELELKNLQSELLTQKEALEILSNQEKALLRLFKGEHKRFKNGRISLESLVTVQNRLSNVRYNLTSQKVKLAKLIVRWQEETDQLVKSLN